MTDFKISTIPVPTISQRLHLASMIAQGTVSDWIEKYDSRGVSLPEFVSGCFKIADELIKQDRDGAKD